MTIGYRAKSDKGLAAADRGEFFEHDDIRKMIDSRYPPLMLVRWTLVQVRLPL